MQLNIKFEDINNRKYEVDGIQNNIVYSLCQKISNKAIIRILLFDFMEKLFQKKNIQELILAI